MNAKYRGNERASFLFDFLPGLCLVLITVLMVGMVAVQMPPYNQREETITIAKTSDANYIVYTTDDKVLSCYTSDVCIKLSEGNTYSVTTGDIFLSPYKKIVKINGRGEG